MSELNDLQKTELEILAEFSKIAARENLTWFAMFGTLLGAVRRKGFIPWDDDIDIALPREDYDKLRLSEKWFDEPFFLQTPQNDPDAAPRFIRLRRSDTTVLYNFPGGLTRGGNFGAYIDIFPLDDVRDGDEARQIQHAAARIHLQMLGSAALDECQGEHSHYERTLNCYNLGGVAGHYNFFAERYENLSQKSDEKDYYAIPTLGGERGYRVFEKKWFSDNVQMKFEGLTIPAPIGWKEVLIVSYPDGLTLPLEKDRKSKYSKDTIIDMSRSYKEYTKKYTDMLREIKNKKVLIFGAGDSLRIWLERYSEGLEVMCAFDNSPAKWNSIAYGVPVRSPDDLPKLFNENTRLIIASVYYKEISKQIEKMGITDYYIFIDGWSY
jgi:lipopolysaccharide cholinephosphotransferase